MKKDSAQINNYRRATAISIDIQMNLLNTWTKYRVADYYQNIFLTHLDELDPQQAKEKIKREIKLTLQRKTLFYLLQNLDNQRKNLLLQLQEHVFGRNQEISQEQLDFVCQKVKEVRDINLQIAETIIKMYLEFQCRHNDATKNQLQWYQPIIEELESNIAFIKQSYLRHYIDFGRGFDPFFMDYYQSYHKDKDNNKESIAQLYQISISTTYRLIKAKNMLLDIRSAYHPQLEIAKHKQSHKFESLPTLHPDSFAEYPKQDDSYVNKRFRTPIKIPPIKVLKAKLERSSRTTIYPMRAEGRPDSSSTEDFTNSKLKFNRVYDNFDGDLSHRSKQMKLRNNQIYLQTEEQESRRLLRRYRFHPEDESLRGKSQDFIQRNHKESQQNFLKQPLKLYKQSTHIKSQRLDNNYPDLSVLSVKNYNPIKRETFQILQTSNKKMKYDYNPHGRIENHIQTSSNAVNGLNNQEPLSKYNKKTKFIVQRKSNSLPANNLDHSYRIMEKIDREMQTVELKNIESRVAQIKANRANATTLTKNAEKAIKASLVKGQKQDETIENEDIIDERPAKSNFEQTKPLIRAVNKPSSPSKDAILRSPYNEANINSKNQASQQKRQVKMKIGKLSIKQVLNLLQATILPDYKPLFDLQKLTQWIKVSQTYLIEFHINEICAIIALCSPIPDIGMALKLWAPISQLVNFNLSNSLFTKYIQFIEKSTSCDKIMFSGDGELFKQLKNCGFVMKKDKLYERFRKLPSNKNESQFKPFLYVECSTVNFAQSGRDNMIFSQQIQEFQPNNCYMASFLGQININSIPEQLKTLIKVSQNVNNFNEVNKILQKESFDQYVADEIKVANINLLLIYFNSSLRSSFVASEGFIKFVGTLVYQKDRQCLISINTTKNNGNMYFSKNMSLQSIVQKSKLNTSKKVSFSVKMFTKKLYGKLVKFPLGCYANCQINLTWQDEMQGRIKHNLEGQRCFGPQPFSIGIELQKQMLYCITINQDDFIY